MNKAELLALLEQYPDDMEVKVAQGTFIGAAVRVDQIVDLDTNVVSIEIIAE